MILSAWFLGTLALTASPGDEALARAIRTAYESNRTALTFGTIRFRFAVGNAVAIDDIKRGAWTKSSTAEGLYVFDGPRARFDLLFPTEDLLANRVKTGSNSYSTFLNPERSLTNGKISLLDQIGVMEGQADPIVHTTSIQEGSASVYSSSSLIPLFLGDPNPTGYNVGRDVERALKGQPNWRLAAIDDRAKEAGRHVVQLTFDSPFAQRRYWIDVERGATPLRIDEFRKGEGGTELVYDDVRRVGDDNWFPFHMIIHSVDGLAKELTVHEADFVKAPDRTMFRLEFPRPIPLIDTATSTRYAPQTTWDLDKLPRAGSQNARKITIVTSPTPEPVMPGARDPWPFGGVVAAWLAGALFLVASAVLAYRRLSHA